MMKKNIIILIIIITLLIAAGYVLFYKFNLRQEPIKEESVQSMQDTTKISDEEIPFNTNDNLDQALQDLNALIEQK